MNREMQFSLKAARAIAGLTQAQLGEAIGVSGSTVCWWETGRSAPTVEQAARVAEVCGIPLRNIRFSQNFDLVTT